MNNNYAGNITPEDKSQQEIYHFQTKTQATFIYHKAVLYTETAPTKIQIQKLNNTQYTIVYSPTPDKAIIRHLTHRITTTRDKALNLILFNQPTYATFQYTDFNTIPYKTSIANIQKQLSTHNTTVKLIDTTHQYTLIIDPCASGTETHIPDLNWENYKDTLRPYLKLLRNTEALNRQLSYQEPDTICQDILTYINIWAPAYDIQIPTLNPNTPIYNHFPTVIYNSEMLTIYRQLKAYESYNIPINDTHTLCPACNLPYSTTILDNLQPCPHCNYDDIETQLDLD